jgi:hypothetical protein
MGKNAAKQRGYLSAESIRAYHDYFFFQVENR